MNTLTLIVSIIILAVIVEYIVNLIKPLINLKTDYPIPIVLALVVGVGLAILVKADFLSAVGLEPSNLYISYIITGLIVSGGSTAVHELIAKLRASRDDLNG